MILQALHAYYERRQRLPDPADRLPMPGLEDKEIPFILELAPDGRLVAISDTRQMDGKKKIARRFQVPQGIKKTSGVAANLLWDTAEYVLGLDTKGKPERVAEQTAAFRAGIDALLRDAPDEPGLLAVQRFLATEPLEAARAHPPWPEIEASNPVLSFRLRDDIDLICQRPGVLGAVAGQIGDGEGGQTLTCLITGRTQPPERLHSSIKGVWGAQTSGANIVSFNLDAFRSFGKEQGANAPVSPGAAFAYTTALNSLLAKGSRQRMQVGDASTVFWAQAQDDADVENGFAALFGDPVDDPNAHTEQVRALYEAVRSGRFDGAAGERRFYVLGLAPNAARIAIRFWHDAKLHELAQRVHLWFDDLQITRGPRDAEFPTLFRLLTAVAVQGKADNVPPNLGGEVMRAIMSSGPFPATWLSAAVMRCRAERQVPYLRAAAIKACLNRSIRFHQPASEEVYTAMLDIANPNPAYRLGRLFAALEKIQQEASPGLNATILDRYYGAASSTPVAVFTTLLRLKNHHLAKLGNRGRATNFERLLGEILGGIDDFPLHLTLPEQGRFALGYYHQRQAFFTKADGDAPTPEALAAAVAVATETPAQASLI
jgi:CRISPR-associated protein Csd1